MICLKLKVKEIVRLFYEMVFLFYYLEILLYTDEIEKLNSWNQRQTRILMISHKAVYNLKKSGKSASYP